MAESAFRGGVALIYRDGSAHWHFEGLRQHGPNVISAVLVSGKKRWGLIGVYIPPGQELYRYIHTVEHIREAIEKRQQHDIILIGDLNSNFNQNENANTHRNETVKTLLTNIGATDLSKCFTQRYGQGTWRQVRNGVTYYSKVDYCFVTNK